MFRTVVQHNLNTIRGTVMKTKPQNEKSHRLAMAASLKSGEAGIRTLGTLARTLVFETSTIGHSVTSPAVICDAGIIARLCCCFQTVTPLFVAPFGIVLGLFRT
jgi:hypothetical protein